MKFELDHFFILTDTGAPAAEQLVSAGLVEGSPNTHPGQGTSNRRFFFSNAMLELLWVHDAAEAAAGPAFRCRFPERAGDPDASPFGLVFRRSDVEEHGMPFPGWKYEPDYLDSPLYFHVGDNSENILEPLCVYIPFARPPDTATDSGPFSRVSGVRITSPSEVHSEVLQQAAEYEGLTIEHGTRHLMEVTFNAGRESLSCDLTHNLPLVLYW